MRIMVFGTFDGLHPGHLYVLGEAMRRVTSCENEKSRVTSNTNRNSKLETRDSCGLWVVVARDSNVHHIKGKTALQSENERKDAIEKVYPLAHVMLGDRTDFLQPIRTVKPDLILLGYDQKLPPSVTVEDLGTPVERLEAFHPEIYKSSLRRSNNVKR